MLLCLISMERDGTRGLSLTGNIHPLLSPMVFTSFIKDLKK